MADFDIVRFGAVGDAATNDAVAIQAAVDAAAAGGGGRVVVPAGRRFRSGTITLRSHVELHLEHGAVLQASGDWGDITARRPVSALSGGVVRDDFPDGGAFIWAEGATGIAITGPGTLDGSAHAYVRKDLGPMYRMHPERPFTVFLLDCADVSLTDFRMADAALWSLRLTGCEDVRIAGLVIRADMKTPNADGIDIDRCRGVRISGCDIRTPDDAISLKAVDEFAGSGECEDVIISDCILESASSAIVLGADATGAIRNVVVTGCVIRRSNRGVSLKLGQEGRFEDILVSDCLIETALVAEQWWGRGEPLHISAFPWFDRVGSIRNVRFVNILARGESGVNMSAVGPGHVTEVLLDNVRIELVDTAAETGGLFDRRPFAGGPDLYPHPISGFYLENVGDATLRDCEVVWTGAAPYFAHAVEAVSCPGLRVEGLRGGAARSGLAAVVSR
ncbi:glycoside hydrolase family 28 protein [Agromyces bauzanensis]|uniref:Glycoside hydrolase family 28 protein n=1 Tax=Agromyces bauzanensis TaxID=1308924 RepID=A0A917PLY1_9MICO|nr:glycosyl hydrolase family 28 protein [Agromyces bauzanensis]GGJ83224.1 hypothetical protein GCM10011372_21920 [Agromyces bauzanensis]